MMIKFRDNAPRIDPSGLVGLADQWTWVDGIRRVQVIERVYGPNHAHGDHFAESYWVGTDMASLPGWQPDNEGDYQTLTGTGRVISPVMKDDGSGLSDVVTLPPIYGQAGWQLVWLYRADGLVEQMALGFGAEVYLLNDKGDTIDRIA